MEVSTQLLIDIVAGGVVSILSGIVLLWVKWVRDEAREEIKGIKSDVKALQEVRMKQSVELAELMNCHKHIEAALMRIEKGQEKRDELVDKKLSDILHEQRIGNGKTKI